MCFMGPQTRQGGSVADANYAAIRLFKLTDVQHVRQATSDDIPIIEEIWLMGVANLLGPSQFTLPPRDKIHAQLLVLIDQQTENYKFWLCCDELGSSRGLVHGATISSNTF